MCCREDSKKIIPFQKNRIQIGTDGQAERFHLRQKLRTLCRQAHTAASALQQGKGKLLFHLLNHAADARLRIAQCFGCLGDLLFGSNGIVASGIALDSYKIVYLRCIIGITVLLLLFLLTRQKRNVKGYERDLCFLAISGAAMGGNWLFLYEAYQQIGVGCILGGAMLAEMGGKMTRSSFSE